MRKKNIYKILSIVGVLFFGILKSQNEPIELQKNDYLTNSETNFHSGIPNINLPLTNFPLASSINVGVSLSYSTEGASAYKLISDVGRGWSLQYGGNIFKSKVKDEKDYEDRNNSTEAISEVYYYNFLGNSGRFYIDKDQTTNKLIAVQIQPSKNKITVAKDDTKPNKILSFSITDENGNSYLFDKVNISKIRVGLDSSIPEAPLNTKLVNTAFLLSTIKDNKNQQVASFEYEITTELITQAIGTLQEYKIKKINISNQGSIEFKYISNPTTHSLKNKGNIDWYQMDKLIVKDKNNVIVSQYAFLHTISDRNFLDELASLDKDNNVIQKHSFEYNKLIAVGPDMVNSVDGYGYTNLYNPCSLDNGALMRPNSTNPKTVNINTLKSISLPTGGRIEYEFESNSIDITGRALEDYCLYGTCYEYYDVDKIYTLDFDSYKNFSNYNLNLPSGYTRFFTIFNYSLYPYPPHKPDVSDEIVYDLHRVDNSIITSEPYLNSANGFVCPDIKSYSFVSPVEIKKVSFVGPRRGQGKLEFYGVKGVRKHKNIFGYGLRIKSVKNYDAGSTTPSKWMKYEYNRFSDPLTSSGETIEEDFMGNPTLLDENVKPDKAIGYANVKAINMLDNSYTKYIFYDAKELFDLSGLNYTYIDFGSYLRRMGLFKQKEVYGISNNLLQETGFSYQSETLPISNIKHDGVAVQKTFIKKETKTVKDYINGNSQTVINTVENNYENQYNNLIYSKETLYDGSIVEKNFKYAKEKNIQKLINANMVGTVLETEVKNDGKVISRIETKLDDASTLYPTSTLMYNVPNQSSFKKIAFNNYDDKGNLRELLAENEIPTATIWGYYQTQPIAEIVGATYASVSNLTSVKAAITASNADADNPANENALLLALDNVRKDIALKSYQITTYTYDPLIGITSKTSSSGAREAYVYDSSHRLSKILDKEGKTLNTYDYHYSPPLFANDEMAQEYRSNNCSPGFLPQKYMYTVPANKYFSYASKVDANQMAYNDVLANGQSVTNQNAGCVPMACTVVKGYDIATLNSASLTMPNTSNFRLQMSFPYDSSLTWAVGKSVGIINGNCLTYVANSFGARVINYGAWKITIYQNGNIVAQLTTGSSSIPNGTIVNFDLTLPIDPF
ncbi:DUF5977 domain-containing protein [Chryseobacterium sp. ISL-6]|uniref:DUF5977 domain-containing protein n=1 Tax=Chryseobacterium sp. ISL-6 TaxID=2819143 RepID=UPI001BE9EF57|nr:DUF5977 domain-containing protein [Chryseobacterium sp. ISL-6]MBT2622439.1 hypothetical protein [Chryseobacterium sp. ISL-6]